MGEIFCVVYDMVPSKLKERDMEILRFWITNVPRDIIDELNEKRDGHEHKGFKNFYEAICFAYSLLELEDRFLLGIESATDIVINHMYSKEGE